MTWLNILLSKTALGFNYQWQIIREYSFCFVFYLWRTTRYVENPIIVCSVLNVLFRGTVSLSRWKTKKEMVEKCMWTFLYFKWVIVSAVLWTMEQLHEWQNSNNVMTYFFFAIWLLASAKFAIQFPTFERLFNLDTFI